MGTDAARHTQSPGPERPARARRACLALVLLASGLGAAAPAPGVELFDGRIQLHGYGETQVRAVSRGYRDELDLTQWYLIANLELELDIAPAGFGPFDLVTGFVRAEGRYDCVWTRACGLFDGANTYGNRAERLPDRLSDGRRDGLNGVIEPTAVRAGDRDGDGSEDFLDFGDRRRRIQIPLGQNGDEFAVPLTPGDPNPLARPVPRRGYTGRIWNLPAIGDLFFTVPGLDVDGVDADGIPIGDPGTANDDVSGCFPGNASPRRCRYPGAYVTERFFDHRFALARTRGPVGGNATEVLGPWRPRDTVVGIGALRDRVNPFDPDEEHPVMRDPDGDPLVGTGALPFRPEAEYAADANGDGVVDAADDVFVDADSGGRGDRVSRGLYYPSGALAAALADDDFGPPDIDFGQRELAWNRGDAQQQTRELKEAYLDVEMFDHRLWLRAGRQTIVWGKTELFRSQDQFNPQDIGIASLPSLEESRIPLWSLRGILSLYDVGPLADVRLEGALVWDRFQSIDLGRCGEPYAPPQACTLSFGHLAHGLVGLGVAGVTQPDDPWEDADAIEFGVRLEWRWERFSFSLTDFYGHSDVPYAEILQLWERNVDPLTGRPRRAGATGACAAGNEADCLGGVIAGDDPGDPAFATFPELARPAVDDVRADHAANQQLFATICASTLGGQALAPDTCSLTIFNDQGPAIESLGPLSPSVVQAFNAMLQGHGFSERLEATGNPISAIANGKVVYAGLTRWATDGTLNPSSELAGGTEEDFMPLVPLHPNTNPLAGGGPVDGPAVNAARLAAFPGEPAPPGPWRSVGLSPTLGTEQEALLGCGDFWGTDCDVHGIDVFNSEASALLQSFPGFEGTEGVDWDPFDGSVAQPGTIGFVGGPVCTRYDRSAGRTHVLPGCRGVRAVRAIDRINELVVVEFDPGYAPEVDGCVFAPSIGGYGVVPLQRPGEAPIDLSPCSAGPGGIIRTLYHPFAGCLTPDDVAMGLTCTFDVARDFDSEFLGLSPGRTAQVFRSEMAALSWNFLMVLVGVSLPPDDLGGGGAPCDPAPPGEPDQCSDRPPRFDEFDVNDPERLDGCSFRRPFVCKNVVALLATTGARRNVVRAGGDGRFGRRDFAWHAGGVVGLEFERRNVLGFSVDFAEDLTKTSWNLEFTWFDDVLMVDNDEFDGLTATDHYNLTISMDRPTFIRFLNASRTFFLNSQLFLQYVDGYTDGFTSNGPLNALMTFAMSTGYYQDRMVPTLTVVHDFRSVSGAVIPSLTWRYTTQLSVTVGAAVFWGRTQTAHAALSGIAGAGGGRGDGAQRAYVDNGLSAVRDRDEIFLRLRYTF